MTHPPSGTVIEVGPTPGQADVETATLVRTDRMEVVRLVIAAGEEKPAYKSPGDVTIHCLEGRLNVQVDGQTQELRGGQLIHLAASLPHSLQGIDQSLALLTIVLAHTEPSSKDAMAAAVEQATFEDAESLEHSATDTAVGRGVRG